MISETPLGAGAGDPAGTRARAGALGPAAPTPLAAADITSLAAALRFLAAAVRARAVVEIGTCRSALSLLDGMLPDGVLTSIDLDPEAHRAARRAFAQAGIRAGRTRLITGRATEVLPRLADAGYDLVLADTSTPDYLEYLELGLPLLRPGGVLAFTGTAARPADTRRRGDPARELLRAVQATDSLLPLWLPVEGGLLASVKT